MVSSRGSENLSGQGKAECHRLSTCSVHILWPSTPYVYLVCRSLCVLRGCVSAGETLKTDTNVCCYRVSFSNIFSCSGV